jgi:hypothetical protein
MLLQKSLISIEWGAQFIGWQLSGTLDDRFPYDI